MTDTASAAPAPGYKDRKTGLVLFGILQLAAGGGCVLFVCLMGFGMVFMSTMEETQDLQVSPMMMLPAIGIYLVAAALFIWLGIGSILARRWARAVMLMLSWISCVVGLLAIVNLALSLPGMNAEMAGEVEGAAAISMAVNVFMFGLLFVMFILVPGLQILFYGSENVRATCEARDPKVRWTDKRPLPVLALTLLLWYGAASTLIMGFYNWAIPFFGTILTGASGAVVVLMNMSILGLLAWHIYRLSLRAWWGVVLFNVIWGLSTLITFSRVPFTELYEKMAIFDEHVMMMSGSVMSNSRLLIISLGSFVVYIAFLLYTKRFFRVLPAVPSPAPGEGT
jgi:hypothetical protein